MNKNYHYYKMSKKEKIKKANLIRTKLILIIAQENEKKKSLNKNVMMLNSKSVEEINEQYQTNNFKITLNNKIINGGKNLEINYYSKDNPRRLVNTPQKIGEYLKDKIENNKSENQSIKKNNVLKENINYPFINYDKILIKAKRKISQNKLQNEIFSPEKKKRDFNIKKQKIIEIQKNNISILRNLANLYKNYNLCKKTSSLKRQKSVLIQMKNNNLKNLNQNIFFSSKGMPKVKNSSLFSKNLLRINEKKKSHNLKIKMTNDNSFEEELDSKKYPSTTKKNNQKKNKTKLIENFTFY